MSTAWRGRIAISEQTDLEDVVLNNDQETPLDLAKDTPLRFLSIVDMERVPLYLTLGTPFHVTTTNSQTQEWFANILTRHPESEGDQPWWQRAKANSPLGVLVAVDGARTQTLKPGPRVTEILLYASHNETLVQRPPTPPSSSPPQGGDENFVQTIPEQYLYALALSSELYHQVPDVAPPTSPTSNDPTRAEAVFLPITLPLRQEIINNPPVRKRKTATDVLDEAAERRHKSLRKGGEGILDGLGKPEPQHRRSISGTSNAIQTRPLLRSPTLSRPGSVRGASEAPRRSTLSRVQTAPTSAAHDINEDSTLETKNKDLISRIVMAGMRLCGLSQSKSHTKSSSRAASPATEISFKDCEIARKNDEDFKLLYHQIYKAVCFAFRLHIGTVGLQPHTEVLREMVDKFLAVFWNDPLVASLPALGDEFTPGGRKAFGGVCMVASSPGVGMLGR